jgi:nucleoside-diphosphate-sugar epimerase
MPLQSAISKFLNPQSVCIIALDGTSASGKGTLAKLIAETTGFEGKIIFDEDRPDGAPRKLMDSSKLKHLGWQPKIDLDLGLKKAYSEFLSLSRRDETDSV